MNNIDLKRKVTDYIGKEKASTVIVLEGDEFADGAIGITFNNNIIYDYDLLLQSLMLKNGWTEDEAIDWLDYNTIPSLRYMSNFGTEPVILRQF